MNGKPGLLRTGATILITLLFFLPLWWVTISAFRPDQEIFRFLSPLTIETVFPLTWTLDSVVALWQSPFARAIANSLIATGATVVIGLMVCASAAFVLAVIKFPGRGIVFTIMIVSFLIPFDAIALPLYVILRGFDLQNTFTGLILPGLGNGLAVFMLRQFFMGVPKELGEAAMIDGLGWFGIFTRIYLPLSGHALIGAALILFVFQWQAYLWPLLIAPAPDLKVAAVAIAEFSTSFDISYGLIFAGAFFVSAIPMVILVGFQRFFAASVASTGGKE